MVKNPPANSGDARGVVLFPGWEQNIPWRMKWQPTPGFLPGKSHGQAPGGLQSMQSRTVGCD